MHNESKEKSEEVENALSWYYPPEYIDALALPNVGSGSQRNNLFDVSPDEWLWMDLNVQYWDSIKFPMYRKRTPIKNFSERYGESFLEAWFLGRIF